MSIWCTYLFTNMQMQLSTMQMYHAKMQMQFLFFSMQNAPFKYANVTSLWCKFPMQGCECKVYSWWCKYLLAEMQMQIFFFGYKMPFVGMPWCECPLVGMSWRECPLVGMSWCKWNLTKNFFYFSSRDFLEAWNQKAFNNRFIFLKDYSFLFRRELNTQCIILAQKHILFWL